MKKIFCGSCLATFLLLGIGIKTVFAEANIPAICSAATSKVREQMNQRVNEFNEMMTDNAKKPSAANSPPSQGFSCAGIGVIDYHSAMDGELYYFNESTRQLISICGMGLYISAVSNKQTKCGEICPPMEWRVNGCDEQYTKYLESQRSKNK